MVFAHGQRAGSAATASSPVKWLLPLLAGVGLLAACVPAPDRQTVYRLPDGHCVNFSNLPSGWKRGKPPWNGGATILGKIDGVKMAVAADLKPLDVDEVLNSLRYFSWIRLEDEDVPGFQAWMADDGERSYVGQDLVDENNGPKYIATCTYVRGDYLRVPEVCSVLTRTFEPRRVVIKLPYPEMGRATVLIPKAEAVFKALGEGCPP